VRERAAGTCKFMISRTPGCAAQSDVFMMKGRDATLVQQRAVNENCEYHLLDGISQVLTGYLLQCTHAYY